MISADTNVIVRLLTGDDKEKHKRAKALFENESIFITTSVILECEWVLRYAYDYDPLEVANAFRALCGLPNVELQEQLVIHDAIQWHEHGLDFADAIHIAKSLESESFRTFDKKLIKRGPGITGFPVTEP